VQAAVGRGLGALFRARAAALKGPARGLVFQLGEAMGSMPAREVAALRAALGAADRKALARLGVRLGTETVYFDALLKPREAALRGLLWAVRSGAVVPAVPRGPSAWRDEAVSDEAYAAMGYRVLGPRVLRVDRLEMLAAATRRLARRGPFVAGAEIAALAGCSIAELAAVLPALFYRAAPDGGDGMIVFHPRPRRFGGGRHREPRRDSPFAKLKELRLAR
jgi:ATP-dependent RNA helicase SUPV3L1/SUV3